MGKDFETLIYNIGVGLGWGGIGAILAFIGIIAASVYGVAFNRNVLLGVLLLNILAIVLISVQALNDLMRIEKILIDSTIADIVNPISAIYFVKRNMMILFVGAIASNVFAIGGYFYKFRYK